MDTKPQCNIGIRPLGRGAEPSAVVAEENRIHKLYVAELMAVPPGVEHNKKRRQVLAKFNPKLIPIFKGLNLEI